MKKSNRAYKTHLLRISAILCLLSSYFWIAPSQVHALSAGFQVYYVLGNEEQIYNMFDHIDTMEGGSNVIYGNQMRSVVSMVATADNQMIYYDHWEDGYEADMFNPTQNSTEIYGDGDPSNGGAGSDILRVGSIISLKSDGSGSGINAVVPVNPRGTALRYDGGDCLLSIGGPVDLVHAAWPRSTTWIGGVWEMYSLQALAHSFSYRIPVGVDSGFGDFVYTWLQVEALYDDTTVTIDNGTDSVTVNLDKGQTYSSMGRIGSQASIPITITEGTTISSDKQTQVGLVTGGHVEFQARFYAMIPNLIWGTEYIAAIPRTTNNEKTEIYLYNPNDHSITVETYDASGDGSITIAAGDVVAYSQQVGYAPIGSAVRLNSDDVFWGLACVDTSHDYYEWGFSLIPTLFLMDDYYVSWAPGNLDATDNAAPVWVAPVSDNTTFYVDYGPVDGHVDETFTIDAMDTRRIFDPDNDNTGMHIWATNKFIPIWGLDPASGQSGEGYLDLGYTVLPLYQGWLDPVLSLEKTAEPEILPAEGGTATFILQAKTYSPAPVTSVDMTDTLPISWTYVAGSTIVTYPDGSTDSPDPVQSGQNLFWNLSHEMGSNQTLTLQFDAQIQTGGSVGARHFDGFESNNYSGGAGGWLSGWMETNEATDPNAGNIRIVGDADVDPYSGDRQLQIADDAQTIYREIDLSVFSQPVLRFKRYFRSLEGGETFGVDISVDNGGSYTSVLSWTYPAVTANTWVQEEVSLSAYLTDTARLRFRGVGGVSSYDYFYLDDVEVYDAVAVNENKGRVAGEYRGYVFNATDEAVVYISALGLEKAVDRSTAGVGDTIEYTLSYRNNGTVTTTGTYVNDTIPWATTFSDASSGGSYSSATNTVSWTLGEVAPSETGSVTFTVTVDDGTPYGTVIENSGQIGSDQIGQANSNVVETTVLLPTTTLSISKSAEDVNGWPLVVSDAIRYTWQVTNTGTYTAFNVTVTDDLPEGVTFESRAADLGSATDSDPVVWTISELATDTAATLWITVTINADQAGQTITNTGSVTGSNVPDPPPPPPAVCPDGSEPVGGVCLETPVPTTTLSISKSAEDVNGWPLVVSDPIRYTWQVTNTGTYTAFNVTVTDDLPDGVTYEDASADRGAPTGADPVFWTISSLPTDTVATLLITVTINADQVGQTITNTGSVTGSNVPDPPPPPPAVCPDGSEPVGGVCLETPVPTTTLSISKSAEDVNGWPLVVSDPIRYTWQVTNTGTYTAFNVTVTDDLPDGVTYEDASADRGTPTGTDPVLWTISSLPTDTVATLLITVTINADQVGQTITNTGSVTGSNVPDPPPPPPAVCPDGSEPVGGVCLETPVPMTTLSISKGAEDVDGPPLVVSDAIRYTWQVTNTGTYTAFNVTVTDDLPDGVTFESQAADLGSATDSDPVVWTISELATDTVATLWITVTINADQAGQTITNTGSVTGSNVPDPPPPPPAVCPDGSEPVGGVCLETPVPMTTLSISKDAEDVDGPPLVVSDTIRYTWHVTNTGTYTAFNVTVTDDLPDGVTFEDRATDLGSATSGDPVVWTISELATDTVATLWITVTINADQAGQTITNTGSVTSSNVPEPPPPPPAVCPDGSEPDPVSGECHVKPVPPAPCTCPPDSYEDDDVAGQAVGLSVDVRQTHDFCDDATDWITFTVQAGNVYTITTSSWGQRADTFLALFDTDAGTLLAANDDYEGTTDYSSRVVWPAPADGVYYVRTTNRAGLIGCATDYDLLIESQAQPGPEQIFYYLPIVTRSYGGGGGASDGNDVYPMGVISHTCRDGYETDDTWQQAQIKPPIETDVVEVHSFDSNPQLYAADKDFVWFDVPVGRTITFTVAPITNTQTLLELYDVHGAVLNVTGATQLVWTPATDGRYYLSVSPLTTTFGCADVVGYNLLLTGIEPMAPEGPIYLPIIMRSYH